MIAGLTLIVLSGVLVCISFVLKENVIASYIVLIISRIIMGLVRVWFLHVAAHGLYGTGWQGTCRENNVMGGDCYVHGAGFRKLYWCLVIL